VEVNSVGNYLLEIRVLVLNNIQSNLSTRVSHGE